MSDDARGPGRPRDEDTDQRILDAALKLMAQHGYKRMSMDQVAAEAGVTKPTIYRRWKNKEELAVAALAVYRQRALPVDTGETRADLIAQLRHFKTGLERPFGMAMIGTVLAEEHDTPHLLGQFREQIVKPRREALRRILERARLNGELRADADLNLVTNLLIGAYYAQYLAGLPFARNWADHVVDEVLAGIIISR
jgi:AcrR family transcriptional regulator